MKYVIIQVDHDGADRVYYFVFPEQLTHSEVARWVKRAVERQFNSPAEVFSAGFCTCTVAGLIVSAHGSESLSIEPNIAQSQLDQRILNTPKYMQGVLPA